MALFSEELLKQFQALLKPLDERLSDIVKQQGDLWDTSLRQSVQNQFGHSFSNEFTIASLQHLAKLICRSIGWPFASDAVDICRVSENHASRLLEHCAAERLLQSVFEALVISTDGTDTFSELGEQLKEDPWFDGAGNRDKSALGRSPAFDDEERKHTKSKLQKVHRLVSQEDQKEPSKYRLEHSTSFKGFTHSLPSHQLQMDVRGKITTISNHVTIEVGGSQTKHEAVQRGQALTSAEIKAVAVGNGRSCGPTP